MSSEMSNTPNFCLSDLPEYVLLKIFEKCSGEDLASLSQTCSTFHQLISSDILWRTVCKRDTRQNKIKLGNVKSYRSLYTNLLHKYKSLLGVYQSQISHFGGLLEIKFEAGNIKGVSIEGSFVPGQIFEDVVEEVHFIIKGEVEPPTFVCFSSCDLGSKPCHISYDESSGEVQHHCFQPEKHTESIIENFQQASAASEWRHYIMQGVKYSKLRWMKHEMKGIENCIIHKPLTIPSADDIPPSLRMGNGCIPPQIITPGLFKEDYSVHGVELILFKYISENEIHGLKVTGDPNIPAGKITIKCFLDYPLHPTPEEQSSVADLAGIRKEKRQTPLHELPKQILKTPEDLYESGFGSASHAPKTCFARYHGKCQAAGTNYKNSNFLPAHVMICNDDLISVLVMDLGASFLFKRVERHFIRPYHTDRKSIL